MEGIQDSGHRIHCGEPKSSWKFSEHASDLNFRAIRDRLFGRRPYGPWDMFCLLHSRHLAVAMGEHYSALCLADKMAFVSCPAWLYLPMVKLSGEVHEHVRTTGGSGHTDLRAWLKSLQNETLRWVQEHADGREDTWTRARHRDAA